MLIWRHVSLWYIPQLSLGTGLQIFEWSGESETHKINFPLYHSHIKVVPATASTCCKDLNPTGSSLWRSAHSGSKGQGLASQLGDGSVQCLLWWLMQLQERGPAAPCFWKWRPCLKHQLLKKKAISFSKCQTGNIFFSITQTPECQTTFVRTQTILHLQSGTHKHTSRYTNTQSHTVSNSYFILFFTE